MSQSAMFPSDSPFLVNQDNDTTTSIALRRQEKKKSISTHTKYKIRSVAILTGVEKWTDYVPVLAVSTTFSQYICK